MALQDALSGGRKPGGDDDNIWIGIVTKTPGRAFHAAHAVGFEFTVDCSHGDGMAGLTEVQKEVYIALLKAAIDRINGGRIIRTPGTAAIERMN